MTASQGNVAELEHLGVRANTLEGDVRIPSSRGLQICAMALGASTQPWELRVPIVEMVVYADIPCLHLPWVSCALSRAHSFLPGVREVLRPRSSGINSLSHFFALSPCFPLSSATSAEIPGLPHLDLALWADGGGYLSSA